MTKPGTRRLLTALSVASATLVSEARAQSSSPPSAATASLWSILGDSSQAIWWRPAASLVIPGTGQLLARAERGALYLAAEAFLVIRYASLRHDAGRAAQQYRNLAFNVARGPFGPQVKDTTFDYFEAMAKYLESGPFSLGSGPDIVPPSDERTFNGRIWRLARETFFRHPDSIPDPNSSEYRRALDFYRRRAIGPGFQWSWRGAAIEQDLFRQTIRASDETFRQARNQLGLLLANHLLSAVDAWVSNRLGRRSPLRGLSGGLGPGLGAPLPGARTGLPTVWLALRRTF